MERYDLTELFIRTQRLLYRYYQLRLRPGGHGADPRHGQGRILSLLKKAPDISQKELGYLLDIRQQSLGELLRKLEQNGFITREPSETDKRAMMVHLTEKGRSAELRVSDFAPIFSCLEPEEQDAMADYLARIAERLKEELDKSEAPSSDEEPRGGPDGGPRGPRGAHGPHGPHGPGMGSPPHGPGPFAMHPGHRGAYRPGFSHL